jgi:hypothetical protein
MVRIRFPPAVSQANSSIGPLDRSHRGRGLARIIAMDEALASRPTSCQTTIWTRNRSRSSFRMRLRCANRISAFFRRYGRKKVVQAAYQERPVVRTLRQTCLSPEKANRPAIIMARAPLVVAGTLRAVIPSISVIGVRAVKVELGADIFRLAGLFGDDNLIRHQGLVWWTGFEQSERIVNYPPTASHPLAGLRQGGKTVEKRHRVVRRAGAVVEAPCSISANPYYSVQRFYRVSEASRCRCIHRRSCPP